MWEVLFWILFALALLVVIPDRWQARRQIAELEARVARRRSGHYVRLARLGREPTAKID
jgi:hypothetical protein